MAEVAGCFSRLYRLPPRLPDCFHRFRRPPPRLPNCFHRFRRPPSRLPDDGSHFFLQLFSFSLSVPDGGGALTTADATSPGLFFPTRRLENPTRRLVNTIGRLCARCAMPRLVSGDAEDKTHFSRLVSAAAEHTTPFSRVARWGFAWCAWPSGPTFRQTDNFQRNIKYVNSFLNFSFGVTLHRKRCMAISNHE